MGSFFNIDSPLMNALGKVCDIVLISLLYVVLCIPIITIGPATTALYYVTVKVIRRERGYLFGEFFKSFKTNFKTGTFVTLILGSIYLIVFLDLKFANNLYAESEIFRFVMVCTFNAILILASFTTLYVFPVLSRFTVKGFQLLKTSFLMSIRHLLTTIVIGVIVISAILAMYLISISIFFIPALACLLVSLCMERILKKYMPEPTENAEEEGMDEWYLE